MDLTYEGCNFVITHMTCPIYVLHHISMRNVNITARPYNISDKNVYIKMFKSILFVIENVHIIHYSTARVSIIDNKVVLKFSNNHFGYHATCMIYHILKCFVVCDENVLCIRDHSKHYWGWGVEAFRFSLVKSRCPLSKDWQNLCTPLYI